MHVYQYALQVRPDEVFEAALVHDILKAKNRHLFKILGAYVPSGRLIFTLQPMEILYLLDRGYKPKSKNNP